MPRRTNKRSITTVVPKDSGHLNQGAPFVDKQVGVRSYQVITDDGRVYRRNRRHLRLTAEVPQQSPL